MWVKIKPPGIGPLVLVMDSIFQGKPFWRHCLTHSHVGFPAWGGEKHTETGPRRPGLSVAQHRFPRHEVLQHGPHLTRRLKLRSSKSNQNKGLPSDPPQISFTFRGLNGNYHTLKGLKSEETGWLGATEPPNRGLALKPCFRMLQIVIFNHPLEMEFADQNPQHKANWLARP